MKKQLDVPFTNYNERYSIRIAKEHYSTLPGRLEMILTVDSLPSLNSGYKHETVTDTT